MKSIERRFAGWQKSRPHHSTFINFSRAVNGGRFSPDTIRRWFNRLVDKDDYAAADKRDHFRYLVELSNPLKTTGKGVKSVAVALPTFTRVPDVV